MELIPHHLVDVPGLRPFGLPRLQPRALQVAGMTCTCNINTNRKSATQQQQRLGLRIA